MNVGKSIKVGLARRGMRQMDLAKKLGVTPQALSQLIKKSSCTSSTIDRIALALDMKSSEFLALGED